jgi:hypothetical protein
VLKSRLAERGDSGESNLLGDAPFALATFSRAWALAVLGVTPDCITPPPPLLMDAPRLGLAPYTTLRPPFSLPGSIMIGPLTRIGLPQGEPQALPPQKGS